MCQQLFCDEEHMTGGAIGDITGEADGAYNSSRRVMSCLMEATQCLPDTALVGAEAAGGGGDPPAAALVVKFRATAMSRGSYVVALLDERYTVTILPAAHITQSHDYRMTTKQA